MSHPPGVIEAEQEKRRYLTRHVLPAIVWLLLSSLGMMLAAESLPLEGVTLVMLAWGAGLFAAILHLARGYGRAKQAEAVLAAWNQQNVLRVLGAPEAAPRNELEEALAAKLGPEGHALVRQYQEESRKLRAKAQAARASLRDLPADGEGARALAEAAEQAEARAVHLDDQLAALYAQALSEEDKVNDALDQLRALHEVQDTDTVRKARERAQLAARQGSTR